jgi:hypothetical protein
MTAQMHKSLCFLWFSECKSGRTLQTVSNEVWEKPSKFFSLYLAQSSVLYVQAGAQDHRLLLNRERTGFSKH